MLNDDTVTLNCREFLQGLFGAHFTSHAVYVIVLSKLTHQFPLQYNML